MGRAPSCYMEGLERGPWTAKEDALLVNYVQEHGEGHWSHVPKIAGLRRCGKSCRLRWMNYLRPDIKRGNFSPDEDDLIIRLHKLLGNRWSLIAKRLPGRTDNEVKNYWNSHLGKRLLPPQPKSTTTTTTTTKNDQPKSSTDHSNKKKNTKTNPDNANTTCSLQNPTKLFPFLLPITRNHVSSDSTLGGPSSLSLSSRNSHGEGNISTRAANDSTEAPNSVTPLPWSDDFDPVMVCGDAEESLFDISSLQDDLLPTEEYHNMMFNKLYAEYQEILISSENHIIESDYDWINSFFV